MAGHRLCFWATRNLSMIHIHSLVSGTLRITSNNNSPLKAGIYTQVQVNPGAGYRASVAWAAPNFPTDAWGRQLGIDPTGGTDPNGRTVIWGP